MKSSPVARFSGSRALLIVPPLLKYATGPLLGPAMLVGAAEKAGHSVQVLDLNARWIERDLRDARPWTHSPFLGDHDRDDALLRPMQERFFARIRRHARDARPDEVLALRVGHEAVTQTAEQIAASEGAWLSQQFECVPRPDLVGVSVMYSGQVLWALAATLAARRQWPEVRVVWGGAHVTALAEEIAHDPSYAVAADAFVAGYAERTFIELLDAIKANASWPRECFRAGGGEAPRALAEAANVTPIFRDLHIPRGARPTLPAQLSRGCAYGKCAYCTYPATEGEYRDLNVAAAEAVIAKAVRLGAHVSFKDSLLTAPLLRRAAELVRGRVAWSGCTKLGRYLDTAMLRELARQGCRTLEIGLETLSEDAQELISKRQSRRLFLSTLDAAADAGIALVVNYMTGFPGVDLDEERQCFEAVKGFLLERHGRLVAKVEHNRFELERRAPFAGAPPPGVRITGRWPWSSVLDWSYAPVRRSLRVMP